jgi:GR25 family glycosyltransferase involved in LPS biosynthesis
MINKAYYINLDHRKDRNEHFLKNVKINIKLERFSAIYGKELNIENFSKDIITEKGKKDILDENKQVYVYLTIGALGCALSHKEIWEKTIRGDYEKIMILEDDVTIVESFEEKLYEIKNKNLDICYLGYHLFKGGRFSPGSQEIIENPKNVSGTFGYIINKKAAAELLKIFPITYQIDSEMYKAYKNLKVGLVKNKLVFSEESECSSLGTDIQIRK